MLWGVNIHRSYTLPLSRQLDLARSIGLASVRADIYDASADTQAWLRSLTTEAALRGMSVLPVVLPSAAASTTEANAYQWAHGTGVALAAAFPAMIWEAGNELDQFAIKPGATGESASDYDDARYALVRGAIRGMYDGFRAGNAAARVAVGTSDIHFAFLSRLAADGVRWDITTEHYYGAPGATDIAAGADWLFGNLAVFGRPILMTEFNQQQGHRLSQSPQTLLDMADAMAALASKHNIAGAFVYELLDQPSLADEEASYGLANQDGILNALGLAVKQKLRP